LGFQKCQETYPLFLVSPGNQEIVRQDVAEVGMVVADKAVVDVEMDREVDYMEDRAAWRCPCPCWIDINCHYLTVI